VDSVLLSICSPEPSFDKLSNSILALPHPMARRRSVMWFVK
jgi:hypothetical protein